MNARTEALTRNDSGAVVPDRVFKNGSAWYVVSNVKSNRVVYFTDDPAYTPPTEANWYFISHYIGDMPAEMTLRNCWGWRFDGAIFSDAREPGKPAAHQKVLESNRTALLTLLDRLTRAVRAAYMPSDPVAGFYIRGRKLQEAVEFLKQTDESTVLPECLFLGSVASGKGITLAQAAALVLNMDKQFNETLAATETLRERYVSAIRLASTQAEMTDLRESLQKEVSAGSARTFASKVYPMTPEDLSRPLPAGKLDIEITRLRMQLKRELQIRRSAFVGTGPGDELIQQHKARLAQYILEQGGKGAEDLDYSLLENYADVHGLSLVDAARLIVAKATESQRELLLSEMEAEKLRVRISAVRNSGEIQILQAEIDQLAKGAHAQIINGGHP